MSSTRIGPRLLAILIGIALGYQGGNLIVHGLSDRGYEGPRRRGGAGAFAEESRLRSMREARGAVTSGEFAVADDPLVAFRLKGRRTSDFARGTYSTDEKGYRVRSGPPKAPGSRTIAIVGDSVAFGFGVADDQTLGHRLEEELARRSGSSPRTTVHTIACPAWNHVSSIRAISDEIPTLEPDLVIFVPVANDLDDGATVLETGDLMRRVDPVRGAADPLYAQENYLALVASLVQGKDLEGMHIRDPLGTEYALRMGVTPTSISRFENMRRNLLALRSRLKITGAELLVCAIWDEAFVRLLVETIWNEEPDCPVGVLSGRYDPRDALPEDAHPNPRFLAEAARKLAELLVERGWFGESERPRAVEASLQDPGVSSFDRDELRRSVAALRARSVKRMSERIDLDDGTGTGQIYGGVFHGGSVTTGFDAVLRNPGHRPKFLVLELQTLPLRGLYPLNVSLSLSGRPPEARRITRHSAENTILRFPIDDPERSAPFLEFRSRTDHWVLDPTVGFLRAFVLERVTLE